MSSVNCSGHYVYRENISEKKLSIVSIIGAIIAPRDVKATQIFRNIIFMLLSKVSTYEWY